MKSRTRSILQISLVVALCGLVLSELPDNALHAARKSSRKVHRKPVKEKIVAGTRELSIGTATAVRLPLNYRIEPARQLVFNGDDFIMHVHARKFSLGNAAYIEFLPHQGENLPRRLKLQASFEGADIILSKKSWGFRGLFAIPPDMEPGMATVEVKARGGRADRTYRFPLKVEPSRFETYRKRLHLGKYSDRDQFLKRPDLKERYEKEKKKKDDIFAGKGTDLLAASISHPRDYHRVTSTFYAKRIYDRYYTENGKKVSTRPKVSFHQGLDLMGDVGTPVYALADGIVAIAEEMYYEGNHTVIDHGAGIFSRYMHQSEILVRTGQRVKAGELIGKVGESGMVTGPHLHVGLLIRGVYVEPTSILSLPIRAD